MTALVAPMDPPLAAPTTKPTRSTAWWGMVWLIATESTVFVVLLGAYFFLKASSPHWPLGTIRPPELRLSVPFSFLLWGSSVPVVVAEAGIRRNDDRRLRIGLGLAAVMGAAFLGYTAASFGRLRFGWRTNAYGSIYYTIIGLHALHVFVGLCMSVIVQIKAWQGKFTSTRHKTVEVFGLYWHFVDMVWVAVFISLFLVEAR